MVEDRNFLSLDRVDLEPAMMFRTPHAAVATRRTRSPNPVFLCGFLTLVVVSLAPGRSVSADRIDDQIAAGEFGPAIDEASQLPDAAEKSAALRRIAQAQQQGGDFEGARATVQRLPQREERSRAGAETVRGKSASGGASLADFSEIIDLITSTVQPDSWDATGGPGSVRQYTTGVYVDPQGQLKQASRQEEAGALAALAARLRGADLDDDMARPVPLRMVSLRRLEQAVAERVNAGQKVPETLQRLAGLTRVQYVFFYPDEKEIVIAGPAEGWKYSADGRAVGTDSGRPTLQLDDLVVVLRAFAPGGDGNFGCSINTRDENLKKLKEFVEHSNRSGPLRPGQLTKWLKELQARLGLQDVVVFGVPPDTRVARTLVEADYRMKLIGVGKIEGGDDIPSYFELLKQMRAWNGLPLEALRWWLTMKYDAIVHTADRTAFEFQGGSVQVQSENQFVNSQGQHVPTGLAEPINRAFAQNFTRHYADLAQRDAVFADLRNVFDLALAAALGREEKLFEKADWDLGVFAPGGAFQPAVVVAPRVVDSVIAHQVYDKTEIVVQVAGGVQANLLELVSARAPAPESKALDEAVQSARRPPLPSGRWWWNSSAK